MKRYLILLSIALVSLSCVGRSIQRDPISRETSVRQSRPKLENERFDSQEQDPTLTNVFLAADAKAERALKNAPRERDFIFRFWDVKKRILKRDFNIDWQSPAELNPDIVYGYYGQPDITDAERTTILSLVAESMINSDEQVQGMRRTFEGAVLVTTKGPAPDEWRLYELQGSENTWSLVRVDDLCIYP